MQACSITKIVMISAVNACQTPSYRMFKQAVIDAFGEEQFEVRVNGDRIVTDVVVVLCYTCLDIPVTANVFGHTVQKHKAGIQHNLQQRMALFREKLRADATSSSSTAPSAAIVSDR